MPSISEKFRDFRASKAVLFWSCAGCIIATMVVGFTWGGWVTGGSAQERADEAAEQAVAELAADICFKLSHQLHGAMGFTAEYVLNDLSKRLLAWRDDCGSRNYWANRVGQATTKSKDKKLWECITEL